MISRQLRYIVYGSSNLTLKKDELSAYGSGAAASEDDSDVQTVMRTTKPSSALPFHFLLRPISSMKGLTYCTEGSLREGVGLYKAPLMCEHVEDGGWLSTEVPQAVIDAMYVQASLVSGVQEYVLLKTVVAKLVKGKNEAGVQ